MKQRLLWHYIYETKGVLITVGAYHTESAEQIALMEMQE